MSVFRRYVGVHRRADHAGDVDRECAVEVLEMILTADIDAAWQIGQDFPDQDFSIVDRTSFAAMHRLGINVVATFDDRFAIYRYGRKRDRAFEVRR